MASISIEDTRYDAIGESVTVAVTLDSDFSGPTLFDVEVNAVNGTTTSETREEIVASLDTETIEVVLDVSNHTGTNVLVTANLLEPEPDAAQVEVPIIGEPPSIETNDVLVDATVDSATEELVVEVPIFGDYAVDGVPFWVQPTLTGGVGSDIPAQDRNATGRVDGTEEVTLEFRYDISQVSGTEQVSVDILVYVVAESAFDTFDPLDPDFSVVSLSDQVVFETSVELPDDSGGSDGGSDGGDGGDGGSDGPTFDPSAVTVGCSIVNEEVVAGGTATVNVTVENGNADPASVTVGVFADGEQVTTFTATVGVVHTEAVSLDVVADPGTEIEIGTEPTAPPQPL